MKIHGNARLLPRQRSLMCQRVRVEKRPVKRVAGEFGVSPGTRW